MNNNGYTQPESLVDTTWVAEHLTDSQIRLVEVDLDIKAYHAGHIPNAIGWDWQVDIQDSLRRNILGQSEFETLLGQHGISNETTVILYGDRNNLFACYAFWLFKYYGHTNVRLMNGGRKKWLAEGRSLDTKTRRYEAVSYQATEADNQLRAYRNQVFAQIGQAETAFVDTRSAKEYAGILLAPEHLPQEGALRGGHIPGAVNIPWGACVQRDGTFKPAVQLRTLYEKQGVTADKEVIVYCRIGERSSLTWFVLTFLLGYPNVRNYDGSWTEWGNLIDAPIERS